MTRLLSATDLAGELGVSKARVSQYVSEGKLDGCFSGEGRDRRFDLSKVAARLNRTLHPGQLLGNGASTKQALRQIAAGADEEAPVRRAPRDGGVLPEADPDRYELARIQKVEEEARRLRRMNAEAEGSYVLAAQAQLETTRLVAQEIAEFETVLREGARKIADELHVDFKAARQILMRYWREHRAARTNALQAQAGSAALSDAERVEDI
jgi:hypothetical protein